MVIVIITISRIVLRNLNWETTLTSSGFKQPTLNFVQKFHSGATGGKVLTNFPAFGQNCLLVLLSHSLLTGRLRTGGEWNRMRAFVSKPVLPFSQYKVLLFQSIPKIQSTKLDKLPFVFFNKYTF